MVMVDDGGTKGGAGGGAGRAGSDGGGVAGSAGGGSAGMDAGRPDTSPADVAAEMGTPSDASRSEGGTDAARGETGTDASDAARAETGTDAVATDASTDVVALTGPAARGSYLVNTLLSCGDCHTPRGAMGAPDMTKFLSGVKCLFDIIPPATNGMGCVNSRNLTPHENGLKTRTDTQIKDMFTKGMRPDGKPMHSFMPYYEYANLTSDDADAVVAYLRTIPAVDNMVPPNEPPFTDPPAAAAVAVALTDVPDVAAGAANEASAKRGRYIAAVACIGCHTKDAAMGSPHPLDKTLYFAGAREFDAAGFGLPVPPFPAKIYTQNLTQDDTGIKGWVANDVIKVLKMGLDKMDKKVCPPMPAGPMGNFGGLTDADAQDIANFIVTLPGKMNMLPNQCVAP